MKEKTREITWCSQPTVVSCHGYVVTVDNIEVECSAYWNVYGRRLMSKRINGCVLMEKWLERFNKKDYGFMITVLKGNWEEINVLVAWRIKKMQPGKFVFIIKLRTILNFKIIQKPRLFRTRRNNLMNERSQKIWYKTILSSNGERGDYKNLWYARWYVTNNEQAI